VHLSVLLRPVRDERREEERNQGKNATTEYILEHAAFLPRHFVNSHFLAVNSHFQKKTEFFFGIFFPPVFFFFFSFRSRPQCLDGRTRGRKGKRGVEREEMKKRTPTFSETAISIFKEQQKKNKRLVYVHQPFVLWFAV
jgi:hypothetical protein